MKVVMIIAHEDFRDEELLVTKQVLEKRGAQVTVASTEKTPAKGMLGAQVTPDALLSDVEPKNYDAIVFVGGAGAENYFDDKTVLGLAKKAAEAGKILAAICIAPSILANAGVLKGKKATVWGGPSEKYAQILKQGGASYTNEIMIRDGNLITADGPAAAAVFGEEIAKALSSLTNSR